MRLKVAAFAWDPSPAPFSFDLPVLGRPIFWYGILFALGFFLGFLLLKRDLRNPKVEESVMFYTMVGTVVGARLFDLCFYQHALSWTQNFWHAIALWDGGLASHGGIIGALVALYAVSRKYPEYSFSKLLDLVALPALLLGFFIRIGNFINQEILGTPTLLPWGVIFGHPMDGSLPIPRHPVQLYEAFFYLFLFALLFWKRKELKGDGILGGVVLFSVFSLRLLAEFFKEEQSVYSVMNGHVKMGQILSLPFLIFALFFFQKALYRYRKG